MDTPGVGAVANGAAVLQQLQLIAERLEQISTAVRSDECRHMNRGLTGKEAGRLLTAALHDYSPTGHVSGWRPMRSCRKILEIQADWNRSCRHNHLRPTKLHWDAVVEAAYRRARAEALEWGEEDQRFLEQKIMFWRTEIPEAIGWEGAPNLLTVQWQLQQGPQNVVLRPRTGDVPFGDLVDWRQWDVADTFDWEQS